MPRKRGLITGASLGARLGGLIRFDDTIDFLRSFGSGLRNYTVSDSQEDRSTDRLDRQTVKRAKGVTTLRQERIELPTLGL